MSYVYPIGYKCPRHKKVEYVWPDRVPTCLVLIGWKCRTHEKEVGVKKFRDHARCDVVPIYCNRKMRRIKPRK